ncbi:phosphatidylinositol phosphatase PTPRQ-like [Ciona intestinalis]
MIGTYLIEVEPGHATIETMNKRRTLQDLTPGVRYNITVNSLSGNGKHSCRDPQSILQFTNESVPGPVGGFGWEVNEKKKIVLNWQKPVKPNGNITSYLIQHRQLFPHPVADYTNLKANRTILVLNQLEPGAGYYVRIAAINSAGLGTFIKDELIKVMEETPGPVNNLQVSSHNATTVTISWEPPLEPNGEIIQYKLTVYQQNVLATIINFEKEQNENQFNCLLDNAPRDVLSSFMQLLLPNSLLQNNPSTTSTQGNGDVTIQALSEIITSQTDNNSTKDGKQRVLRSIVTETNEYFEPLCPVATIVTSLKPFTNYRFNVVGWTAVGEGVGVDVRHTMPQEIPEGPPLDVRVDSATDSTLRVMWSPPVKPNGIVTYTINIELGNRVYECNTTYYDVTNLKPFSTYAIKVKAKTKVGEGPWSDWIVADTLEGSKLVMV